MMTFILVTLQCPFVSGPLADPKGWSFKALGAYVESLTCVAAPSWPQVVLVGAQHLCAL